MISAPFPIELPHRSIIPATAFAVIEPDVAVISAVPAAIAVTRPSEDTVASLESYVVQVTVASPISWPLSSVTVTVSRILSPGAEKLSSVSDKTILAAA